MSHKREVNCVKYYLPEEFKDDFENKRRELFLTRSTYISFKLGYFDYKFYNSIIERIRYLNKGEIFRIDSNLINDSRLRIIISLSISEFANDLGLLKITKGVYEKII